MIPRPTDVGAIVLAAGSGRRFGGHKQFLELAPGERMVDRAVAMAQAVATWVVVVLPAGSPWDGCAVYAAVGGGSDRLGSVRAGLSHLPADCRTVLVHDAAHPLATVGLARRCLAAATESGVSCVVPWLEVVDVVKQRKGDDLTQVGREGYGTAQVPMVFDRAALVEAHRSLERHGGQVGNGDRPVEDSHLLELSGYRVVAVPGEVANVHVVDDASLAMARALAAAGADRQ